MYGGIVSHPNRYHTWEEACIRTSVETGCVFSRSRAVQISGIPREIELCPATPGGGDPSRSAKADRDLPLFLVTTTLLTSLQLSMQGRFVFLVYLIYART